MEKIDKLFCITHRFQPFKHPVVFLGPKRGMGGTSLWRKGLRDWGRREWGSGRKGIVPVSRPWGWGGVTMCVSCQTRQMNAPGGGWVGVGSISCGGILRQVCTLIEISSLRIILENYPSSWQNPCNCAGNCFLGLCSLPPGSVVPAPWSMELAPWVIEACSLGARSTRINGGASHSCLLICWWGGMGWDEVGQEGGGLSEFHPFVITRELLGQ